MLAVYAGKVMMVGTKRRYIEVVKMTDSNLYVLFPVHFFLFLYFRYVHPFWQWLLRDPNVAACPLLVPNDEHEGPGFRLLTSQWSGGRDRWEGSGGADIGGKSFLISLSFSDFECLGPVGTH